MMRFYTTLLLRSIAALFLLVAYMPLHHALINPTATSIDSVQRLELPKMRSPTEDFQDPVFVSRRGTLQKLATFTVSSMMSGGVLLSGSTLSSPAWAAQRPPLDDLLYRILRVREATQQETRLIKSGKFKDVQRANVKLAVKFMIQNYRLNDAFVGASAYLESNNRRVEAGQVGQQAVQNLYTILEYFDSADVQNIKVGQSGMGGKEELVLKGLEATRKSIDDFLEFFPKAQVDTVVAKIAEENALNIKEFDPALGDLINVSPLNPQKS
jgi:hypothetical protein